MISTDCLKVNEYTTDILLLRLASNRCVYGVPPAYRRREALHKNRVFDADAIALQVDRKSIHAVTMEGFLLKVSTFIFLRWSRGSQLIFISRFFSFDDFKFSDSATGSALPSD